MFAQTPIHKCLEPLYNSQNLETIQIAFHSRLSADSCHTASRPLHWPHIGVWGSSKVMSSQRDTWWTEQRSSFLHFFYPNLSVVSTISWFPWNFNPRRGGGSEAKSVASHICFLFLECFPQTEQPKTTFITWDSFRGPAIQVWLARYLWLRISHKVALKMSAGSSVISRLVWGGGRGESALELTQAAVSSQRSSIAVSKRHSFLATWASPGYNSRQAPGFPQSWSRGKGDRPGPRWKPVSL